MNFQKHIKVYIVGGYVRDRLLDRDCNDHDFVVVGSTPEEMLALGFSQVGADFPVFLHPKTSDEFALARTERKVGSGYNGFETDFGVDITLDDDLARRDLTINSMAREVISWNDKGHAKLSDEIIDPFNGQDDLAKGILCHTTAAFSEDPLRVLRTARFRARYGFDIHPSTNDLMKVLVLNDEMENLTAERVWTELVKAIGEDQPHLFFSALEDCGAMGRLFPGVMIAQSIKKHIAARLNDCSLMERLMMVFADSPISLLKKLRAPLDVQRKTRKFQQLVDTRDDLITPELMLDFLKLIDGYRQPDELQDILATACFYDFTLSCHVMAIQAAMKATKNIGFDTLSKRNQDTLTGKEIGMAIDDLRLKTIEYT